MVAYRWGKVNTHFSAKVCTLRMCTHLQPVCDTFFACKNTPKITFGVLLGCLFICKFYKMLVLLFAKTGMVFQQTCTIWCKDLFVFTKNCTIFPSKILHFAHFLPIRGCFLMFLHCATVSKNVSCALAI